MTVDMRQIGRDAFAVSTTDGREIGCVRLVDAPRQVWREDLGQEVEVQERVWVIDGRTERYGNRFAAVRSVEWIAGRERRLGRP